LPPSFVILTAKTLLHANRTGQSKEKDKRLIVFTDYVLTACHCPNANYANGFEDITQME
jgi:hypothetical protein